MAHFAGVYVHKPKDWLFQLTAVSFFSFLLLLTAGCGVDHNPVSPPAVTGNIVIDSPANGSRVQTIPVNLQVTLEGGATLSSGTVTINGQDVTKDLVAGTNGTLQATLGSSLLYVGSNRIQATVGTQVTKAAFTYSPPPPELGSPEVTGPPDVVPIQTRVVVNTTNSSGNTVQAWAIQVGQSQYIQPHPSVTNGFQVVLLKRSDLSLVSNTDYNFTQLDGPITFSNAIAPQASMKTSCGTGGCLEIIQSLTTLTPPCTQSDSYFCGFNLSQIGGTGSLSTYINDDQAFQPVFTSYADLQNVAYSYVGNVNTQALHAGSNFERLTCSATSGCPTDPAVGADELLAGVTPNGSDGTLPNLNGTGSTGTTHINATSAMPAMDVSNNGAIAGELVLDNCNAYTFAYADPPVHFAMGVDPNDENKNMIQLRVPSASSFRFPDGSTTQTGESAALPATPGQSRPGGFLLTAFDATTFQNLLNSTFVIQPDACQPAAGESSCTGPDGTQIYPLGQLQAQINSLNSRRAVFFLQSIGNLNHNCSPPTVCEANSNQQGGLPIQDIWDRAAQGIQNIGGTYATFVSLDNPAYGLDSFDQYTPNAVPNDDYVMVGQWWLNSSGTANPYAKEESSQINRQTINGGGGSRMTGLLEKGRDGYYRATLESEYGEFFPKTSATIFAAPLLLPIDWPLTGAGSTSGQQAAYHWISEQLMGCITNCDDIRAAYSNLNQDPAIWLAVLTSLQMPGDCITSDCGIGFSNSDFQTAQTQLVTELRYVGVIRQYQSNLLTLLQAEQSNQGLILQQELDALLANTTFDFSSSSYGAEDWRTWLSDGLKILGPSASLGSASAVGLGIIATDGIVAAGAPYALPAVAIVSGIGVGALDLSAEKTNDTNGRALEEQAHELVAGSNLAGTLADQYADILISIGHDFNRIYADWGRLSAVGTIIADNGLVWTTDATGSLL